MFPMELAMRTAATPTLCDAYGVTREQWNRLRHDPAFQAAVEACVEELKDPKTAFRMKARLQSEELLKTSWDLIHDRHDIVAPAVKAQLIQATWRMAGVDASKEKEQTGQKNNLHIVLNLG